MTDATYQYAVLVNEAGYYALHPSWARVPAGWQTKGFVGTEDACVAYVEEHWTAIRPPAPA